ncbi:DUF5722 domain-containing protein [Thermasporomyces composti]|uniref:DUF5722 domain-containing protein n=1 Tax=Thermasporomyces composti TaxID=696763 RepID=UPI0011C04541|nr:DUF5722 domain-containing protein [Thermasporomyces composti]
MSARRVVLLVVALVASTLWSAPPANAAGEAASTAQDPPPTVTVHESDVTVSGELTSVTEDATVELYELGAEVDTAPWTERDPVTSGTPRADGSYSLTVPRFVDGYDRLYSAYVVVVRDSSGARPIGGPRFAHVLDFPATNDFPYPEAPSKKGLQVQMTDDAEELGVQHAAINVPLNEMMLLAEEDPADTIRFDYAGRTWYFDRSHVEALDNQIKPLSDNGQVVNLILLVYRSSNPNSAAHVLIHPDADLENGGPVFGFNTVTAEGVAYFTAAMEFLAQRYTREDQAYGRAVGFIVSNEVDAQWTWSNSGDKTLEEFLEAHSRAVRIVWQATRKAYTGARTYISLTHCWTTVCGANPDPERPTRYYKGRDVIDVLNAMTKRTGDFPWYVAYHPYPENLFDPAFWEDESALPSFDTPRITFKNIEVLPEYLAQPELTYQGERRRVILSEQGCHTPDDSEAGEKLQAACYAYAYYKIRFLDTIDAFILHRHVDHKQEGGLRLGLWTWDEERPEGSPPGRRKYVYDVFRLIDTARSTQVTEFAKEIVGIDDWADVIPGFDEAALAERPEPTPAGLGVGPRPVRPTVLTDFSDGTQGWRVSDNATGVSASGGVLRVSFSAETKLWRGADLPLPDPLDLSATPYLTLRLRVPADDGLGDVAVVKVKAYATGGRVAEGVGRLVPGAGWVPLALDLTGWDGRDAVHRIKVWVRGDGNGDWAGTFALDDVAVAPRVAGGGSAANIELSARMLDRAGVGSPLEVTVANHDLAPLEGALEVRRCDGVLTDPASLDVTGVAPTASRVIRATIAEFAPEDRERPVLCVRFHGVDLRVSVEVPPPIATTLFGFDGDVQGWRAGENVSAVTAVTSFANGPGRPHGGTHALDAQFAGVASDPKTVTVTLAQPLDLSAATHVIAWVDSYGGAPGATGYEVTVRLFSGEDTLARTVDDFAPDRWNQISVDVRDWDGRARVTRIDVTFRATGTTALWDGHFQVDDVGYLS